MRWLLSCQRSGVLRELLRAQGHDAFTNDIEPAEDGSLHHIQGDAIDVAWSQPWDAMFGCPECRHLCSSGQHRTGKPGQRTVKDVERAEMFFMALALAPIPLIAIENSIGIMSTRWRDPDQIIQPYHFSEDASKGTCLWLKGLPLLPIDPNQFVPPRMVCQGCKLTTDYTGSLRLNCECGGRVLPRWANQTDSGQNRLAPGPNRSADRARNYPGIMKVMAAEWGRL